MRVRVLGGLGAVLTVGAVAVLVRPELTNSLSGVVSVVESQEPNRLLLALGSVVGSYAAWAARGSSSARPPEDGPAKRFAGVGDPPETVSAADRTRTGESFDARIEAACSGDAEAFDAIRSTLAETATGAYARAADCSPADARRAIETGTWTQNSTAAAFLAGETGPGFSLLARLRAWLDPSAERRRRIEQTIDALGRVLDDDSEATEEGKQ